MTDPAVASAAVGAALLGPAGVATDLERRIPLYETGDVRDALGLALGYGASATDVLADPSERVAEDTEQQARLRSILAAGEDGRWRDLARPADGICGRLLDLEARAPHLGPLARLVAVHVRAARAMAMPTFMGPVLLVGATGVGKTWFLSRLGKLLGLPFNSYAMASSSLSEGLSGSHPSWRNSGPGLVARTLLTHRVANPLFFVDELDKAQAHAQNSDPYRPFYVLLEPEGARSFVDEFLGFPLDASRALWVFAANETSAIPSAILDRLTVLDVPDMDPAQRRVVALSLYADANEARRGYFSPEPSHAVLERLAGFPPRSARLAVEHAMAVAASEGRRSLGEDDVRPPRSPARPRIGFR